MNEKTLRISVACAAVVAMNVATLGAAFAGDYPHAPAALTNVTVTGGFWLPRFETNRLVTLRTDFEKCEFARIPNFRRAAAREWETFKGIPFDDSDVYKVIEGAAYTLATHPDAELEKYVDGVNAAIAGAQEPDGYLYTARTLGFTKKGKDGKKEFGSMGPTRWSNLAFSHELYNVGHLYEAACAYFEATGKRTLLDVAIKSADLIDRTFGPDPSQLKDTSGHEEIELALCKLYRTTGETRYLKLAQFLLEMRGRKKGEAVKVEPVKGYCAIVREWTSGDVVEVAMNMPVRRIKAHDKVVEDRGRLAVERGPIVFCAEGVDNGGKAFDVGLPADATFAEETVEIGGPSFLSLKSSNGVTLVPYCIWGNREPGNEMQTWFKTESPAVAVRAPH